METGNGKRLLCITFALLLLTDLCVMGLTAYIRGLSTLVGGGIRLALTLALMAAVGMGWRWARWVSVALLTAGLLASISMGVIHHNSVTLWAMLPLIGVYAFTLYVLGFETSVQAFLASQRHRTRRGHGQEDEMPPITSLPPDSAKIASTRRVENTLWALNGLVLLSVAGFLIFKAWDADQHNVGKAIKRIEKALVVYEEKHGAPPATLAELGETYARAAERNGLHYAFSKSFYLIATASGPAERTRADLKQMADSEEASPDGSLVNKGHFNMVHVSPRPTFQKERTADTTEMK